jgi:hypothetical protein
MLKKSIAKIVAIRTILCVIKVIIVILTNILTGLSPSFRETDTSQKDSESDCQYTKTTKRENKLK